MIDGDDCQEVYNRENLISPWKYLLLPAESVRHTRFDSNVPLISGQEEWLYILVTHEGR